MDHDIQRQSAPEQQVGGVFYGSVIDQHPNKYDAGAYQDALYGF